MSVSNISNIPVPSKKELSFRDLWNKLETLIKLSEFLISKHDGSQSATFLWRVSRDWQPQLDHTVRNKN